MGCLEFLKMFINLIRTKLTFSNARIIRFPIDIKEKNIFKLVKDLLQV